MRRKRLDLQVWMRNIKTRKLKGRSWAYACLIITAALAVSACGARGNAAGEAKAAVESPVIGTSSGEAGEVSSQPQAAEPEGSKADSQAQAAEPEGSGEGQAGLAGIPVDTQRAEAVSIYYGSVCYSYFSEDKADINKVAALFTGFSLEEAPDGELNPDTTYQIYFSTAAEQIAAINVDKNGIFYIPEEKKFYKVKDGTFHFDQLDQIYKDSMYKDGFDENQCFIQ